MSELKRWPCAVVATILVALLACAVPVAQAAKPSPAETATALKKLKRKAEKKTVKKVKKEVAGAPGGTDLAEPTDGPQIKVSSCKKVSSQGATTGFRCAWSAKGELPGIVPFRCNGGSKFSIEKDRVTKVDDCENDLDAQAPLLVTRHEISFGYFESWDLHTHLYDELAASGANIAKLQLTWRTLQPSPGGSPSTWNWAASDPLYNQLVRAGVRPVITFGEAPCWAAPSGPCNANATNPVGTSHIADYAKAAAQIALRYPNSSAIEVWLEPNNAKFWGADANPQLFSDLVGATATAVHAAGNIPVFSGGLAPGRAADNKLEMGKFLTRAFARGGIRGADGIGFHAVADVPFAPGTDPTAGYLGRMRIQAQQLFRVMAAAGASKPLEITQLSFSTAGPTPYTEAQQAEALVSSYNVLRRITGIPLVIVSKLLDTGDGSKVQGFGVLHSSHTPKPAFCQLADKRGVATPAGC